MELKPFFHPLPVPPIQPVIMSRRQCNKSNCIYICSTANSGCNQCPFHLEQKRLLNSKRSKDAKYRAACTQEHEVLKKIGIREYNEVRGAYAIVDSKKKARITVGLATATALIHTALRPISAAQITQEFYGYLTGPHRKANSNKQIHTWLRHFQLYVTHVHKKMASTSSELSELQAVQQCSLQDLLQEANVQSYLVTLHSPRQKVDFVDTMGKVTGFRESLKDVCTPSSMTNMKKSLVSQLKSKNKAQTAKNRDLGHLIAEKKWPVAHDIASFQEMRRNVLDGLTALMDQYHPTIEALLNGSILKEYTALLSNIGVKKILSGYLNALVCLDGKPCRPINLNKLTIDDAKQWMACADGKGSGLYIVTEEKASCKNETSEIPMTPFIKKGIIDLILLTIRNKLAVEYIFSSYFCIYYSNF